MEYLPKEYLDSIQSKCSYLWFVLIILQCFVFIWFFIGNTTSHLTVSNELFLQNDNIEYWQFEVVYWFESGQSSSSMYFKINHPPSNGTCSINPLNNITRSLFTISCENWYDENGIKDYSVWTNDFSPRMMIGFSLTPIFEIRLWNRKPMILIRDKLDSIREYHISSVNVPDHSIEFDMWENSSFMIQKLSTGNQNDIMQILNSIFQKLNTEDMEDIFEIGIPLVNISISKLSSQLINNSYPFNQSILDQYNRELNISAYIREYLINFTRNLVIAGSQSIILQASGLVQLTNATNQLTSSILVGRKYVLTECFSSDEYRSLPRVNVINSLSN